MTAAVVPVAPHRQIAAIRYLLLDMTIRYGGSTRLVERKAIEGDEVGRQRARRAADRQYRAIVRLTDSLVAAVERIERADRDRLVDDAIDKALRARSAR